MNSRTLFQLISVIIIGLLLLIYGKIARVNDIYFLWESYTCGEFVLLTGIILLFVYLIRQKKAKGEKSTALKVLMGMVIFFACLGMLVTLILNLNDAYPVAKEYLIKNSDDESYIGKVNAVSIVTSGSISTQTINHIKQGNAQLYMIAKGEKGYQDVVVSLTRDSKDNWIVTNVQHY